MSRAISKLFFVFFALGGVTGCSGSGGGGASISSSPSPAYLYLAASTNAYTPNSSFNSRSSADLLCSSNPSTWAAACTHFHAVISFVGDTVATMQSTYGIPTGPLYANATVQVASSWSDAIASGLTMSLNTADSTNYRGGLGYWTGSNANGTLSSNCTNWVSNANNGTGSGVLSPGNSWISNGGLQACNTTSSLLCVCW